MSAFSSFQIEVIRLMAGEVLSASQMQRLCDLAHADSCEYTGSGYFLP